MTSRSFPAERTALVTGGGSARGIGRALAHRLAAQGWAVAVVDIDGDAAASVAGEIAAEHGVRAFGARMDVGDPASVRDVVAKVEQALPPLVGLANIAGVSSPTEFGDVTVAEWDRVLDVNLRGTFLVTRPCCAAWSTAASAGWSTSARSPRSAAAAPTPRCPTAPPRPASSG